MLAHSLTESVSAVVVPDTKLFRSGHLSMVLEHLRHFPKLKGNAHRDKSKKMLESYCLSAEPGC